MHEREELEKENAKVLAKVQYFHCACFCFFTRKFICRFPNNNSVFHYYSCLSVAFVFPLLCLRCLYLYFEAPGYITIYKGIRSKNEDKSDTPICILLSSIQIWLIAPAGVKSLDSGFNFIMTGTSALLIARWQVEWDGVQIHISCVCSYVPYPYIPGIGWGGKEETNSLWDRRIFKVHTRYSTRTLRTIRMRVQTYCHVNMRMGVFDIKNAPGNSRLDLP